MFRAQKLPQTNGGKVANTSFHLATRTKACFIDSVVGVVPFIGYFFFDSSFVLHIIFSDIKYYSSM